jgi:hypothetical protein
MIVIFGFAYVIKSNALLKRPFRNRPCNSRATTFGFRHEKNADALEREFVD